MVVAGGRNIADEYFMRSATDNFVDMDALVIGDVVPKLQSLFDTYWNSPHVYPVQTILASEVNREELQRRLNVIQDLQSAVAIGCAPSGRGSMIASRR